MKKNSLNRVVALVLAFLVVCSSVITVPTTEVQAAAKATKITLSKKKQIMYVGGQSITLKVKSVKPKKASKKVKWDSSNKAVATVNKKGKVTAKSVGTTTITAVSTTNKKAKASCKITVKAGVKKIHTASKMTLQKGKKATLKIGVTPSDASNKMKFKVKGKAVKVDKKGKITAKKVGNATITVQSVTNPKVKVNVKVAVKKKFTAAKKVTLDKSAVELKPNEQTTIKATTDNGIGVYWISSDTNVAAVDKNGKVTAVSDGTAKVTAYAEDSSGKSASATITVKTPEQKPVNPAPSVVAVESVTVEPAEVTLEVGTTQTVKATVAPSNASDKTLTWSSDAAAVATVDKDGKITAVKEGTTTVKATSVNGKVGTVKVTVTKKADTPVDAVAVESVTVKPSEVTLEVGAAQTVEATVAPSNASDKTLTWSSDNDKVATVDKNGKITAVAEGSTTVKATSVNGKVGNVKVTVTKKADTPVEPDTVVVESVTVDKTEVTLKVNEKATVTATVKVQPETDENKKVTWASADTAIATVDENGTITAVEEGTTTVTVTSAKDSSKSANVTVKVIKDGEVTPEPGDKEVESVTIKTKKPVQLKVGKTLALEAEVLPADAADTKLTWTSENADIVKVDENGTIEALKVGTTTVTATSVNNKKDTIEVTVLDYDIIDRDEEGITRITLKDNVDYAMTFVSGNKKVERTVTVDEMSKAYDAYVNGLAKVTSVEQLWNKITMDTYNTIIDKLGKDGGVKADITTADKTKTITAVKGNNTVIVTVTLTAENEITVKANSSKLTGDAVTVVMKDIDVEAGTAIASYDGYDVTLAWNETSASITKDNVSITASYADNKYVLIVNEAFADEMYQKVLKATTVEDNRIPENYDAIIDGLAIVEAK